MSSATNKPVNGQSASDVESDINRLLGLLLNKKLSTMTYNELTTNIMDPFVKLAKKDHYAAVWYNCVLTYGISRLSDRIYGKSIVEYVNRMYHGEHLSNSAYYESPMLKMVEELSINADSDPDDKCRALSSFFCGEYYRITGDQLEHSKIDVTLPYEYHTKAYDYYNKALKLNFSLKPGTEMHDFFDPDAGIITADVIHDPRLTKLAKTITAASPAGQAERLRSMPITRILPRLTPSSKITRTNGNTTNAYTNGRRRNNLASEKGNIIKRVWLTVKDITRENDREGIVDLYDEILHLPKNPKELTNEQTKLFIPTLPNKRTLKNRINPFKTFHKFTKASNENITRKINVQNNKGSISMPTHEYIRRTQTPEMIENYQIMAYNELIGLLLVLMEKANDKFLQENAAQRVLKKTGQKITSFFRTDEAGIISLDTLSENYVQTLIGYNMEEQIRNAMAVLNTKYSGKQSGGYGFHGRGGEVLIGALTVIIFTIIVAVVISAEIKILIENGTFSPVTHLFATQLPNFFTSTGSVLSSTFTTQVLPLLIAEVAMFQATAGVFTVAALSYKVYKMYRGRKRAFLLKDIFKQIHIALFKNNNTQKFEDIQDKVYFFKNLSEKEKSLLLTMGPKIDMQTSDKELSEYLSQFLSARQARLESSVIKSLANGNANNEELLKKALEEGKKVKPGDSFTVTNPAHVPSPANGSRKRSVMNKNNKMLPAGVHRIEEGGKSWIEGKNGKRYNSLKDYMSRNEPFQYNGSKSKTFDTYPDGTPLPKGWAREVQGDEMWYHNPDGKTQWEAPHK